MPANAKTKSSKSKKGATTYDVLMATAVAAIEQIKTLAANQGQSLTQLLVALKEKSAVATKPVMEDDLALLFAEFAPAKAGDVAVDYERQMANATRLANVFLAIVRAAKGEATSAKPPPPSATLQEGDDVPTGTMKRYIALKTFLLELRGHLSEEAATASKQYRQGANQRFVDAFSVLDHVREELGNLSDALTGKRTSTLIEMLEMARGLKRAKSEDVKTAAAPDLSGLTNVLKGMRDDPTAPITVTEVAEIIMQLREKAGVA